MINRITICLDGHIIPDSDCLGRTGEHNATVLQFSFFESLNGEAVAGLEKYLVAILPEGNLPFRISGDFPVPSVLTQLSELPVFVEIRKGTDVLFKSYTHIFTFADTGENKTVDTIGVAVSSAREEYRAELEDSLETATGENLDGKTWDELKDTVADMPIVTEEKQEALDGFELVKFAVENSYIGKSGNYDIATAGLFTAIPYDTNGNAVDFRLPYFNTSRAKWEYVSSTTGARMNYFSSRLREIGLDCTKAINFGTLRVSASIFEYMQKIKLTNVSCPIDGAFINCKELETLEIYGVDGVISPTDLRRTFSGCNALIEVLGDEFDLSNVPSWNYTELFKGCYILQYIRFKPFSIKASVDFGDCRYLHYKPHTFPQEFDCGTLLSILNAIPNPPAEGDNPNADITITFNSALIEYMGETTIVFDVDTGLWYYKNPNELTPEDTIVTDISGAFVAGKGVTLAWKN